VCLEIFEDLGAPVVGCLSSDGSASATLPVPVLGPDSELEDRIAAGQRDVFVAVGDNRTRLAIIARVQGAGGRLVTAVSPHATCSRTATLGEGTVLLPGAIVNAGARLGDAVIVNTNASIDHDCEVGSGVHVAPGVSVAGGVRLGRGVFVGVGASLIPGVSVGDHATVGAGSVVLGDIEAGVTVAGVPARVIDAEAGPR
jgi:UDP-perosamine 4-acetyltransferase